MVLGEVTLGDLAQAYAIEIDANHAQLTLADFFDVNLDHAPQEGATLALDSIVLVARSISGGRVSVVGLRLPEDDGTVLLTRVAAFKRMLAEVWSSMAGS